MGNVPMDLEDKKGIECKHAVYCKANDDSCDDLLVIKEKIHMKDGSLVSNLRFIKNYPKDFYITKPGYRKYNEKKEWEDMHKLQKFTTTEGNLLKDIARALNAPYLTGGQRNISKTPYLYGSDISTPTLIKHRYKQAYPDCISQNDVAVIDIETDILHGTNLPILVGITFKNKAFLGVVKSFVEGITEPDKKIHQLFDDLLGDYKVSRNIELEVLICDNDGEACAEAIKRAHQWQPDFLTAWNMDFDIPRITKSLENNGYNPADVWSDPRVPPKYRFFKYTQGKKQKVMASGVVVPIHPADRWHLAECPASFFIIDSMCVYKRIRAAQPNESSYSLDHLLNMHLGIRKLKFKAAEGYSGLDWHEIMQEKYKIEYSIYNIFDCIGVELFDEKVKDLALIISVLAKDSEYTIFNSQPKRLVDELYFECLENNKVIATCSNNMAIDLDDLVVNRREWVLTLPSHLRITKGINILEELPDVSSEIFTYVSDLDVSAAYPTAQVILNISKETTYREICKVKGVGETRKRYAGINLLAGPVNAYSVTRDLMKAPKFDDLLKAFIEEVK